MGCCCLPLERVELTVNSKKKQMAGSKWAKSENGPRVKLVYYCLPPERVELTVNSQKEPNGRVQMGQESRVQFNFISSFYGTLKVKKRLYNYIH